nr:histidine kinase N-terminal 7TM domain-containing protein [Ardenticatena sp.]
MSVAAVAILILWAMAAAITALVMQVWYRFRQPALRGFILFGGATVWWCITHALSLLLPTAELKLLVVKVQYPAIVLVPLGWLLFTYEYTQQKQFPRWVLAILGGIGALTVIFLWGYPAVDLVWQAHELATDGLVPVLRPTYGPWFWIHVLYAYGALFVGALFLLRFMLRRQHVYRGQTMSLLLAIFFPWLASIAYLLGKNPLPGIDTTPYTFGVSVLALVWGLFRYQLFRIVPVARETVIRSSPTGVVVLDLEGRIIDINPAALEMLGTPPMAEHDVLGRLYEHAFPDVAETIRVCLEQPGRHEITRESNGEERYYEVERSELHDDVGRRLGTILTLHDVTEARRTAMELAAARDAAEAASHAKSVFLANMSHELRTPLTVIIGYTEMLMEDIATGEYESLIPSLERIQLSGRQLLEIIGEILDMSKIEAGKMRMDLDWFDVQRLLDEVVGTIRPLVRENDNAFEYVNELPSGLRMYSDRAKVRQILYNLLSNAAKFTQQGTVRLHISRTTSATGQNDMIRIEVHDTGVGIPEDKLDVIFRPFEQGDNSPTRAFGGTGLGLPITRHFCELLGGSIHVVSKPGQGSTFTVVLPLVAPQPGRQQADDVQTEVPAS